MKFITILLIIGFNIKAQITVRPVLSELSKTFHNIRDFTSYKNEAYFTAQSTLGDASVIVRVIKTNNKWSRPSIASFSGQYHDLEPFLSKDGLKLLFSSKRPKAKNQEAKDYDIWYVSRESTNSQWSVVKNMGENINTDKNEFYPSLSINNNLYFTANNKDSKGRDDIYFSEYKKGEYQASFSLNDNINTGGDEYNAFIAPDESYLIFGAYKRKDGYGSGDLYISYKDNNNQWLKAKNMGANINSKFMDYCPFVEPKTNVLYFTSKRSQNKSTEFSDINDMLNSYNHYKNGMSRVYKTIIVHNKTP